MGFSDEILMAYADGELPPAQCAAVEQAIAADPDVARRVAQHRALRARLQDTYEPVLKEQIPRRLLEALREHPGGDGANVIPLRRGPPRTPPRAWQWAAIAASLLLGAIIGQFVIHPRAVGPLAAQDGQLVARGTLADALNHQLANTQSAQAPVQMGITYLAKDGQYCRTFTLTERSSLAGLACRSSQDWHVQMLVQSTPEPLPSTQYRRAASALPNAISQAVEAQISGEPLDAREEAAARGRGWSPQISH
jgi:hypothetical protein